MQLIPAIDLMSSKIVRLSQGEAKTAKVYEHFGGPVEAAKRWYDEGASKLHIIDLDAAFGQGNNHFVIAEIAKNINLPIQVGGGIHSFEVAEKLFSTGIHQVMLGSLAFKDFSVITRLQDKFGKESVIVALDNKNGQVMINGWRTATNLTLQDALDKFIALGVNHFLITSIMHDGLLDGPDLETLAKTVKYSGAKILAAGGIGSIDDLFHLKEIGVDGAVIGKALYESRFTLKQAIQKIGV
ncbi:MAG: 1-(5-phosphoribosyl)-5-[(5-phosphoribosylamino)methylideneamino]imidazole-4-carboxamide isomerase [Nitrososphaerota archaeon]|jgi:phosphoribosylformimino-5-aminoimidazole carboxamide ribotide isomerase|uniref:1-(5-phosphoribosyl)-5-[(5- phosphoribosylamino)methylideneamino]imidazole-4- carboxamide isomerase n=1 Tax=Candidatus Bathycorpusculum sp. TaxID=2994959 RepID=UPI002825EA0F|nr:1-(5-phosphoribosyl)-5-[(5-phosphoribosylamino)methylideneamino]imidazole-4-carboxamide isomerase [Candidatus Termiticorpusculum sp.]MCL2256816.1 1-(5-phosphoribosyl)-5-[(5-phosphoribosylamino)methylideneamino]imidazole-4-carboxamide isomerase [Candidatus Termiticorpusculum sp.]MCL2293105.1 1-(5-phosphoribosyl)-5-[(5-phosphoribosylamino)methylideneamino]imidazole-4-carboxamide isomerase [Candidatus Termiticorpusculum sp.]MDR0460852.1 1-(5-phosphoribosyl)-5-[(5-phosphoribosylamino)methylidenea